MTFSRPLLAFLLVVWPSTVVAQHDYRNLDHGRPIATEDAYPVEQGAFEVMFPWAYERHDGERGVMFEPEFMWGLFRNGMIGMGGPILLGEGGGLAGLRPFAFYNFNTESRALPALALRVDGSLPVGALGGDRATATFTLIATTSYGATRWHANASLAAAYKEGPLEDGVARHAASLGVDHTLWRHSAVIMADVQRAEDVTGEASWIAGAGVRMQATPVLVFDVGVQRRLGAQGPDLVLTAGLTKSFALGGGVE